MSIYIATSVLCGPRENRVAVKIILAHKQLCSILTTEDMNNMNKNNNKKKKGYYDPWSDRLSPYIHLSMVTHLVQTHFVQNNK